MGSTGPASLVLHMTQGIAAQIDIQRVAEIRIRHARRSIRLRGRSCTTWRDTIPSPPRYCVCSLRRDAPGRCRGPVGRLGGGAFGKARGKRHPGVRDEAVALLHRDMAEMKQPPEPAPAQPGASHLSRSLHNIHEYQTDFGCFAFNTSKQQTSSCGSKWRISDMNASAMLAIPMVSAMTLPVAANARQVPDAVQTAEPCPRGVETNGAALPEARRARSPP